MVFTPQHVGVSAGESGHYRASARNPLILQRIPSGIRSVVTTHDEMKLRTGSTRAVLLVGCLAIKLPALVSWRRLLLGLLANMQERQFWTMKHPALCPVLWSLPGGFVVVMRRAEPITRDQFDAIDWESWKDQPDLFVPCETKLDSFGWVDGRIVAVDYGN